MSNDYLNVVFTSDKSGTVTRLLLSVAFLNFGVGFEFDGSFSEEKLRI